MKRSNESIIERVRSLLDMLSALPELWDIDSVLYGRCQCPLGDSQQNTLFLIHVSD
jgi:hypothetical protein